MEVLGDIVDWMAALSPGWSYAFVLLVAYGENVMPPIPGDMVVVFGGYLAGRGMLDPFVVVALSTLGGALGFMTVYALGRKLGEKALHSPRMPWLTEGRVENAQGWMERWGYGVVAANRFLTGARSVISLAVGMARLPAGPTAWWCTVSAAVWTALIVWAGYTAGQNWEEIVVYLNAYGRVVVTVLGVIGAVQALRWWRARRKQG